MYIWCPRDSPQQTHDSHQETQDALTRRRPPAREATDGDNQDRLDVLEHGAAHGTDLVDRVHV